MAARRLPGTALQLRRGRRRDLVQVQAFLGAEAGEWLARHFRRIIADLGSEVYVAEDAGGKIIGVVSVLYARSLMRGGLSALLDGARVRNAEGPEVLVGLVAFAEERARRRGCRRLAAWVGGEDADLRAALLARGYRAGELLVTELARAQGTGTGQEKGLAS
jgi:hypothetical protein